MADNAKCNRWDCFAFKNGKCTCLNSTYEDKKCPFYKTKNDEKKKEAK